MRFYVEVTSSAPYPITTKCDVECTSWNTAANRGVMKHLSEMRSKKKIRRMEDTMHIKLLRLKEIKSED